MPTPRARTCPGTELPRLLTRRSFVGRTAAASLLTGRAPVRAAWAQPAATKTIPDLPHLDGHVLLGEADRQIVAADYGGHVSRLPLAVLRPGTAQDVVRMVD
jgi:cytokinin dehydrogenase